ncbi:MAG: DUF86 domain-containing protein [Deltaproteobacteria bacterium]|nr:DUF86 domain-containing protein [Deltaproteobacteria bacterium]MBW2084740.1 DUF86 domain-containing protein [Deltaproteobacteria bacterium]
MKDERLYLLHILESINRIEQYTAEGKETFFQDVKTQDAVLRNLQVLAESTQHLSDHLKASHPDVPWRAIAGLRNVLVHDYLGIKLETVWRTIETDLLDLKTKAQNILDQMEK